MNDRPRYRPRVFGTPSRRDDGSSGAELQAFLEQTGDQVLLSTLLKNGVTTLDDVRLLSADDYKELSVPIGARNRMKSWLAVAARSATRTRRGDRSMSDGTLNADRGDGYSRLEHDERELPIRRVLHDVRQCSGCKSLVSFLLFYAACVWLATVRMDWWTGHETLVWVSEAHENVGVPRLEAWYV